MVRWIRSFSVLAVLVLTISGLTIGGTHIAIAATDTLDQSQTTYMAGTGLAVNSGQSVAQTFTAGLSGTLDRIEMAVEYVGTPPQDLSVQIETTTNGVPSDTAISSTTVPYTSMQAFGTETSLVNIPLTTQPTITAGTVYAIVLSCSSCVDPTNVYSAPYTVGSAYSGGSAFDNSGTGWSPLNDQFAFQTYVVVRPTISTQATTPVTIGSSATDTATLAGGASPTGTITFTVYGPSATPDCSGTPDATSTATVNGNGRYTSGSFTTTTPGTYYWIASYGGDVNNGTSSTMCGDTGETLTITNASPTISTQTTTPVTIGGSATDTATLASGASPTGTITFSVYGPSASADCSGTPDATSTATVSGNGQYTSDTFTPSAPGTYYWIASYGGDANNGTSSTKCGDTGETLTVNKVSPTISTQATTPVTIGGSATDTATLSGGSSPTGSITFSVYGPNSSMNCSPLVYTSTATVNGNGQYSSGTFTPAAAGTYYWIASYGGDGNNNTAATKCGDTGETLTVPKSSPTISTQATTPVIVGGTATDTATLSLGSSPTGTITFSVYGPSATPDCSGTPDATSTATVNGDGQYTSGTFTPTAVGTYYWIASYGGDTNNNSATTICGDTGESSVVNQASPTISTQAATPVTVGGSCHGHSHPLVWIQSHRHYHLQRVRTKRHPELHRYAGCYLDGHSDRQRAIHVWHLHPYRTGHVLLDCRPMVATPIITLLSTKCGDTGETLTASKAAPTLTTQATTPVGIGGAATDTATLASAYQPGGTITFRLYGPSATASCSGTPVFTSTVPVSNAQATSAVFHPLVAGSYYWVASYSGDMNNQAASTRCGDGGETLVVSGVASSSIHTYVLAETGPESCPSATGFSLTATASTYNGASPSGALVFTDAVHHLRLIGGRVLVLQATATTADIYGSSQQNGVVVGYHLHLTVSEQRTLWRQCADHHQHGL